ncbi:MAG: type II secretion system protein [bacterium]
MDALTPPGDQKGLTLIEAIVAYAILVTILSSTLVLYQSGIGKMAHSKLKRQAHTCGTLLMEYLQDVPPDAIFSGTGGALHTSNFSTGSPAFMDLPDFLSASGGAFCMTMSTDPDIQLQYMICPGCEYCNVSVLEGYPCNLDTNAISCLYYIQVRLKWNSPYGRAGWLDFHVKRFKPYMSKCATAGCGGCSAVISSMPCILPPPT